MKGKSSYYLWTWTDQKLPGCIHLVTKEKWKWKLRGKSFFNCYSKEMNARYTNKQMPYICFLSECYLFGSLLVSLSNQNRSGGDYQEGMGRERGERERDGKDCCDKLWFFQLHLSRSSKIFSNIPIGLANKTCIYKIANDGFSEAYTTWGKDKNWGNLHFKKGSVCRPKVTAPNWSRYKSRIRLG